VREILRRQAFGSIGAVAAFVWLALPICNGSANASAPTAPISASPRAAVPDAASGPILAFGRPVPVTLLPGEHAVFGLPAGSGPFRVFTRQLAPGTDTVIQLLDEVGRVVASDDDGGDEPTASAILTAFHPTARAVRVGTFGGDRGRGGSFVLVVETAAPPRPDPNVARTFADAASRGAMIPGVGVAQRLLPGEAALFAVSWSPGMSAMTFGLARGTDTVLEALDQSGAVLAMDDDGAGAGLASLLRLPQGTAFVRARHLDAARPAAFSVVMVRLP